MSRKPLISILTPVYNRREYIEQTIQSVLSQTFKEWEWIILDDGSTDDTGKIITGIKDGRIKYTFQEHSGPDQLVQTFNRALTLSSGELVAMLDSDDYWPDYKLAAQVKRFDDPDIVLSYGECCVVDQKGKKIGYMRIPDNPSIANNNPIGASLREKLFKRHGFIPNSTVMLRKSALMEIGGFVEAREHFQDFTTWTTLTLRGRFSAVPLCLGYWRRHPFSSSFNRDPELRFNARLEFIKGFVLANREKICTLGMFFDVEELEKHWEEMRKEQVPHLPYNRAMLLLSLGMFKEAAAEFRTFIEKDRSIKSRLIYSLINLSSVINMDLANPAAEFNSKMRAFFQRNR